MTNSIKATLVTFNATITNKRTGESKPYLAKAIYAEGSTRLISVKTAALPYLVEMPHTDLTNHGLLTYQQAHSLVAPAPAAPAPAAPAPAAPAPAAPAPAAPAPAAPAVSAKTTLLEFCKQYGVKLTDSNGNHICKMIRASYHEAPKGTMKVLAGWCSQYLEAAPAPAAPAPAAPAPAAPAPAAPAPADIQGQILQALQGITQKLDATTAIAEANAKALENII